MDVFARRALLQGQENPGGRTDYVSGLQGRLTAKNLGGNIVSIVRYVPDRFVLVPDSFNSYLKTMETLPWPTLEDLATALVKDISNEMLTRWTQVNLKADQADFAHVAAHEVTIEDRQPGWRNDDLIYRLPPL